MTTEHQKTAQEIAAQLIANGYQPVPIPHGRKGPIISGWQKRIFTSADFAADANIGIRCGDDGVAFCDIDVYCSTTAKAIADEWLNRFPAPHSNWLQRTGQAPKTGFLFRLPEPTTKFSVKIAPTGFAPEGKEDGIEILCKGQQVVAFGIHPETSQPYRWHGFDPTDFMGEMEDLPVLTSEQINEFLVWCRDTYTENKPDLLPSMSHTDGGAAIPANSNTPPVSDSLHCGKNFEIDLGRPTGVNDHDLMGELLQRAPNNLDRREWVKLAASLRAEWGEEFKDAFVAFSGRYSGGPCTAAEAVRLWNSATPSVVTGASPAFALMKAALGDVEFSALHAKYASSWHTVAPGLSVTGQAASLLDGFKIWNASDLAAQMFKPIRWLVDDLVPTPGLAMVAGAPKVGKSWFAMMLAFQIASGGDEVIYIASEDNDRRLCDRLKQLAIFPPKELKLISGLSNTASIPRGAEAMEFLAQIKQEYPATACIMIDTVAAIRVPSQREKNYDETENEFAALRRLAHELGIAIIVVHHTRKSTGAEASPLETILGSQGIGATVETVLVLQQVTGSRNITVHLTGKDVDQNDLAYRWDNPGFQPQGDPVVAHLGPFQRKCLDCIRQHPRCRQALIEQQLDGDKGQISKAVGKLVERGLVQRTEDGLLIAL